MVAMPSSPAFWQAATTVKPHLGLKPAHEPLNLSCNESAIGRNSQFRREGAIPIAFRQPFTGYFEDVREPCDLKPLAWARCASASSQYPTRNSRRVRILPDRGRRSTVVKAARLDADALEQAAFSGR